MSIESSPRHEDGFSSHTDHMHRYGHNHEVADRHERVLAHETEKTKEDIFKKELLSERLKLKSMEASEENAKVIFETIKKNKEYLEKWIPWVREAKSVDDALEFLKDNLKKREEGSHAEYGIFSEGKYIGSIEMLDIDLVENKFGEMGYWLSSEFAGQGLMTEAVKALEKEFFENIDLNRIIIRCDAGNVASARVAEKSKYVKKATLKGINYNGYFDEYRDTVIFEKFRPDQTTYH